VNELQLRDLLHGAAASSPPPLLDDAAAAHAVVAARGRERRRRTQLLIAAVCAAVLAVVVPLAWSGGSAPDRQVAEAPSAAVLDWPTRGSLAGDADALAAVRALPWDGYPYAPDASDRRVLFLGDVAGGGRWALVAAVTSDGVLSGQWFAGPDGAAPSALRPDSAVDRLADVGSVSHSSRSGDLLLVLTSPGDAVEVSPRVIVGADGSVRRNWNPVDTEDGVAVTGVDPGTSFGSVRYRVLRDGEEVDRGIGAFSVETAQVYAPASLTPLHDLGVPPDQNAVDLAVRFVLGQVGLPEEGVEPELLFSVAVDPVATGDQGAPTNVVAVAVPLPDGGIVLSTAWFRTAPDGSGAGGSCGAQAHPAGTQLDALAVAANCAFRGRTTESVLVTLVPPAFDAVEVVAPGGGTVARTSGEGPVVGVAGPAPAGSVARLSVAGQVVAEQAVLQHAPDQLVDLAGNGPED
jgi:hypothetical protein